MWTNKLDTQLIKIVPENLYDFHTCSQLLPIDCSAEDCRLRFAHLSSATTNKKEQNTTEEVEEEAVRWTPDVDKLLITVCNECFFDFDSVSVELGKRLNRRGPVNARICRMRYAALDKYGMSGKQQTKKETETTTTTASAPAPPVASSPSMSPAPLPTATTTSSASINNDPTVMLELPSESIMSALASTFEEKHDDRDSKDNSEDRNYATEHSVSSSGELSELAQVLAFLDSEEASSDRQGKASFEELFGIPETNLDRSSAISTVEPEEEPKKVKDDLPDGKFDLTKFSATFDRVARAIGAVPAE